MLPLIIITALLTFLVLTPILLVVFTRFGYRPTILTAVEVYPTNRCAACAAGICHEITPSCEDIDTWDEDYLDWLDNHPEEIAPLVGEDPEPRDWGDIPSDEGSTHIYEHFPPLGGGYEG
jgi:hypothetical protein